MTNGVEKMYTEDQMCVACGQQDKAKAGMCAAQCYIDDCLVPCTLDYTISFGPKRFSVAQDVRDIIAGIIDTAHEYNDYTAVLAVLEVGRINGRVKELAA